MAEVMAAAVGSAAAGLPEDQKWIMRPMSRLQPGCSFGEKVQL